MRRILLVEDHDINREMLCERLMLHGFEVLEAIDGGEAISLALSQQPDLILMDMSLPNVDGWEATRCLKGNPLTAHIPVVALTAHAMIGDRERCLAAGCDDYTSKPIQFTGLLELMGRLIGQASAS